MRRVRAPELTDDLPVNSLATAVRDEVAFLEKAPNHAEWRFGPETFTKEEYLAGLRHFLALAADAKAPQDFYDAVRRDFDFYEVYGQKSWGDAFVTSYYEPLLAGSLKKTEKFTQPLYSAPDDLVSLDLTQFDPKTEIQRKLRGRVAGRVFVPYYSREDIDVKGALNGRKLELCWVDPIDAFTLQIQGSGMIDLGDGRKLRVNYAEKNGQGYEPVGKFLKGAIPPDQLNLHTVEAYLRKLPPAEAQRYLNMNPSYVFFRQGGDSALTSLGLSATDGRTIATDPRYFPKGALAFLTFDKPRFPEPRTEPLVPSGADTVSRFVLDQDIGGAITGGGRVDLFWGRGAEAKLYAGAMKSPGKLYYLAPKRAPQR